MNSEVDHFRAASEYFKPIRKLKRGDLRKNKEAAFQKCVESPQFKAWHRVETMKRMGTLKDIEARVNESMVPENLRVEYLPAA